MILRILGILMVLTAGLAGEPTAEQLDHIKYLENRIIAPCCWTEPVADHRSEISLQIRDEIENMVVAGKTDREILDHYKAKYGMRILVEPEGGLFWVMNIVPVVMLILGAIVAVLILRKWLTPAPGEPSEQSS